jgi:protein CpxP
MKSPRVLVRPCFLAASLLLTYPLASLAAPEGDSNGPCSRPEAHDFRAPPPPGPGPGPGMGPEMGPGFGFSPGMGAGLGAPPPFLHGLHLTDEQQDKVFAIVYAAAPAVREQGKALHKAHEALHELNQSDQYDESRVKSLAEAAAKAESQMTVLRMRTEHEIFALLTPEQKKQLEEHRQKAHEHDGGHPPA